eukprot:6200577-Pleurochrysis_carterae.AAC.2
MAQCCAVRFLPSFNREHFVTCADRTEASMRCVPCAQAQASLGKARALCGGVREGTDVPALLIAGEAFYADSARCRTESAADGA